MTSVEGLWTVVVGPGCIGFNPVLQSFCGNTLSFMSDCVCDYFESGMIFACTCDTVDAI